MEDNALRFGTWDYVVFALMLSVSAAIGIFFAFGQKTTKEFLQANRSMGVVPVAISILVSFMSAILILGTPAEMYVEGTQFYMRVIGSSGALFAALIFVPLFFPLKVTSSYEVNIVNNCSPFSISWNSCVNSGLTSTG
ncbi:hypothetical protein SNE40_007511 [Patella caerulea]|uniref:Sodium-coupled monocarboxylate transporter 1 n=1 Tax=Patella caerulea TaxID=87958 RepID=A0AAN8JX01_PATCE